MSEIIIQINSLSLNGMASFDGSRFGAALERELTNLVSAAAPAQGQWSVETLKISLPSPADADAIGVQVAQAIYAQMSGEAA